MDTKQRVWISIAVIVSVVAFMAGVSAWLVPVSAPVVVSPQGVTNFDSIHLSDSGGTATPVFLANQSGTGRIIELQDASTPVAYVNDGGALGLTGDLDVGDTLNVDGDIDLDGDGFDVNITAGFSIDGDNSSNISVSAGDITVDAEAGSVTIIGSEAAADSITLDANDTVTSGLNIDVGSVSGMTIDGGLLDIGGGTCGVADGDNDVCIAAVLEVDGELELDGALDADSTANFAGAVTLQGALYTSFTDLAVSDGQTITPTYTTYSLDTTGAVTITLAASAQEGQLLILINDDANAVIIADTNLASSDGNAITLTDADDIAVFVYQDAVWHELLLITDS